MARKIAIPPPNLDGEALSAWETGQDLPPPAETPQREPEPAPEPEPKPEESKEPEERPRAEDGKFKAKEPEPKPEPEEEAPKDEAKAEESEPEAAREEPPKEDLEVNRLKGRLARAERQAAQIKKEFEEARDKWFSDFEAMRNPEPDPELEPERHAEWKMQQLEQKVQRLESQPQQDANTAPPQDDIQTINDWVANHTDADPDEFQQAFKHLHESLVQEFIDAGESEDHAEQLVTAIGYREAKRLMDTGGSWTRFVMHHAKQRGFGAGVNGSGGEPQPNPQEEARAQVAEDLTRISKGRGTTRSEGRSPAAKEGELTKEQIAAIKDPEERRAAFHRFYAQRSGAPTFRRSW